MFYLTLLTIGLSVLGLAFFGPPTFAGMEGVRFYTKLKTVTARWPTGIRAGAKFGFKGRNWARRASLPVILLSPARGEVG